MVFETSQVALQTKNENDLYVLFGSNTTRAVSNDSHMYQSVLSVLEMTKIVLLLSLCRALWRILRAKTENLAG